MARPKGSKNKPKDGAEAPKERKRKAPSAGGTVHTDHNAGPSINPSDLSDDQRAALFFTHVKAYEKALAVKKKADADFKNTCKTAKSEGTTVEEIKLALMEPDAFEAKVRAEVETRQRVARWLGSPLGTQLSLLDEPDRQPAEEKAFGDGKRAGLSGATCDPPYAHHLPQANQWRQGWAAGQEVLHAGFKQKAPEQRAEDADEFSDLEGRPDLDSRVGATLDEMAGEHTAAH